MRRNQVGIALVSLATLLFEVNLTRLLSFTLWYHFAFLVVGVALLGTACAGSWLAIRRVAVEKTRPERWALALAILLPLSHSLFQLLPFEPFRLASQPVQWLFGVVGVVVLAMPFFATGVVVASLLARSRDQPFAIYAADLVGAGAGAACAPLLIRWAGAPGAVLVTAALAALAAFCFTPQWRRGLPALAGAVLLLVLAPGAERLLPWRVTSEKQIGGYPAQEILGNPELVVSSGWDIASRVDVIAAANGARILIDAGTAVTRVPQIPDNLKTLRPMVDATTVALRPAAGGRVLVIGSGGGWEVLRALSHGAVDVDAVEINPLVVDWVQQDQTFGAARLFADSRVHLVHDEARAFIGRSQQSYDAILMVHTISNAAYGAGAMSLAEDYILTTEAFVTMLQHLSADGLLFVTRPDAQMARLVNTAAAALAENSQEVDRCGLAFRDPKGGGFFSGLLLGKRPLSAELQQTTRDFWQQLGLQVYRPGSALPPSQRSIVEPATDNSPFFAQRIRFSQLRARDFYQVLGGANAGASGGRASGRMSLEERPVAEVAAVGTGAIAAFIGLFGVLGPLLLARRTRRALAHSPLTVSARFGFLGLAFLFVEIALMQQVTRVVGHPSLAFAVVLGAILVGSGLSSLLLAPVIAKRERPVRAAMFFAAAVSGLLAIVGGPLLGLVETSSMALRLSTAIVLCAVVGLALGTPFPIALRHAAQQQESVPWAFAVNGFASVAAPALAVLLGAQFGLVATLLFGSMCYLLAGLLPAQASKSAL